MGESLHRYIDIKLHHLIEQGEYCRIYVCGRHDRMHSLISNCEKNDKLINWQRPTAKRNGTSLVVACFPGRDYVQHYASLIATHLALSRKNPNVVTYELPAQEATVQALLGQGLNEVPLSPTIIIGKIEHSLQVVGTRSWSESAGYIWATNNDMRASLLGCKFSFWGDICGVLTKLLYKRGVRRMLFLGKLGSLRGKHEPNSTLTTGDTTVLQGRQVKWKNDLEKHVRASDKVITGRHITVPSVIHETKKWLRHHSDYDFVDPEIGHMARAASKSGMKFAYLHIVSDNLARKYDEDLSNERIANVLRKREVIQERINKICRRWLAIDYE
ncbi:MAG: hypothetical protein ABIN18_18380 [Pseudomonadota bacterium]